MPLLELPNGQSAIIRSREEITERQSRAVSRAYMRAASAAVKLAEFGFDDKKPETWVVAGNLSEEDQEGLTAYQVALIVAMVSSWTLGDLPTDDSVLDLPKATFDLLAEACSEEFNRTEEFGPDGVKDPKAPIAD
jgi:hypothetical protein